MKRRHFLIISNLRSGSTLLESMIGALPGVYADKEIKWRDSVAEPLPVHLMLPDQPADLTEWIDSQLDVGDAEIVGSKLVFNQSQISAGDLEKIKNLIPRDWYVIHVTRNFKDIFFSRRRGVGHIENAAGVPIVGPSIRDAVVNSQVGDLNTVSCDYVSRTACYRELTDYLEHDLWALSLKKDFRKYIQVEYGSIFSSFQRLSSFLGLDGFSPEVAKVIAFPPLVKLPPIPPEKLVANADDLEDIFGAVEQLRQSMIVGPGGEREEMPSWQAYQERGDACIADMRFQNAIDDYTQALKGCPPNPALFFSRGRAKMRLNDNAGAIEDFEAALKLTPENEPVQDLLKAAKTNLVSTGHSS